VEAERRQVTVLFADMVGFTTFSEKSGEEGAFTLMRSLSKLMEEAVREQGGMVQSFTGDGIMAVFGAPVAFEDAPLRACRAALSILQRLRSAGGDLESKHGLRPQLRIGLNTGPAVVGNLEEDADARVAVLGDTVNVAARLQKLAEPDSVFMSDATYRSAQGMIDASFAGEHNIKGKTELQKVYRLDGIRHGTARFEAALSRGLSAFVGRERELEVLEHGLAEARSRLRVVDIAADPGIGKSRLLHEFRRRIGADSAFVLSGSCSPDAEHTPFLPFIELVRGSFRVSAGEAEDDVARKLEMGLSALGLNSARNIGLLLNLLGLKVPAGALDGLDGVLLGLRTRELLQQWLERRCRLSPVVIVFEDLQWIDSVSEEVLDKVVGGDAKLRLLLLTTRRLEYTPPWSGRPPVIKLQLEPLPVGHIRRLIQARLGVEDLPEAMARQVTEKAEGNPLFAEEIVSFLTERGIIRATAGKVELDTGAVAVRLPASVQSLLTARVDRLAPNDRALLQVASVIGRRFDPQLLAGAIGETDVESRLAAMQALDLVRPEGKSSEYAFKHALVRDALYQALLTEARTALHAKIAAEIERRSGNRLIEVAEVLAHHYSQTDDIGKAFAYLSMAGAKSLGVYSLDEAATHFTGALVLLDRNPECASDDQVVEFLVPYTLLLNLSTKWQVMIELLKRYLPRVDRLGDDPRVVLIRHNYVLALFFNTRYREAAAMQRETLLMAQRLGDARSRAYALTSELQVSIVLAPTPLDEFHALKRAAIGAVAETTDAYIQNWSRHAIGWEEIVRGRIDDARETAAALMQVGRQLNDPRSVGLGLALLSWIAVMSDSYAEALEYSEQSLAAAVTPIDRSFALPGKGFALALLRRTDEAVQLLEEERRRGVANGYPYVFVGTDGAIGVCKVLQGDFGGGTRFLEAAISRREEEGHQVAADWYRVILCDVYLQFIARNEKLPFPTLLKNLPFLLRMMVVAPARIRALATRVLEDPQFDPAGFHIGRAQMILGLLYKAEKKPALAVERLTEARRIYCKFGQSPILSRIDAALAQLRQ
jgi:class 3 adenylate cyclase/tetratricopeptide (TPR) repeat protein